MTGNVNLSSHEDANIVPKKRSLTRYALNLAVSIFLGVGFAGFHHEAQAYYPPAPIAISNGYDFSCGLGAMGSVKCWGFNTSGQLGDGTLDNKNQPVPVQGLSGPAIAISSGFGHSCAVLRVWNPLLLKTIYPVQCWGTLGDGKTGPTPSTVPNINNAKAVAAGGQHTCALLATGEVYCWGYNHTMQLGVYPEQFLYSETPVKIDLGAGVTASAIAAGDLHTCAIVSSASWSNRVKCWGDNRFGELGRLFATETPHPPSPFNLGEAPGFVMQSLFAPLAGVTGIYAGQNNTCARMTDGKLKCWGYNDSGQLGAGIAASNSSKSATPVDVAYGLSYSDVAVGRTTCGISSGMLFCWGGNSYGQLLTNNVGDHSDVPVLTQIISGAGAGIYWPISKGIAVGDSHVCVIVGDNGNFGTNQNTILCWGNNKMGELGIGTFTQPPPGPNLVIGGSVPF